MVLLPPLLHETLERAPRVVIAPVGIGFGQEALAEWAREEGREVHRDVTSLSGGPLLLLLDRRSRLAEIPHHLPLADTLVLEESQVLFDLRGWGRALPGSPDSFVRATFEQSGGWPAALDLARRIAQTELPLHRHPLAIVALERLLPSGEERRALERLAGAPFVTPDLHEPLGVGNDVLAELDDRGFLFPTRNGRAMPPVLRHYLRPQLTSAESLAIAHLLLKRRLLHDALSTLAEAELWEEYLRLLADEFEPHGKDGEANLRRLLGRPPRDTHESSEYRYLVGSLERLRGEVERAQDLYRLARKEAAPELRARIDNARGVAFALQGRLEAARRAFTSAVRGSRNVRLEGESRHNRAGVFIQQVRFGDAEEDLRHAVANFREAGDYVREARSLQLLALSRHRRGLLQEAKRGYEDALELLATLGQPTTLLRTNLAEVLLLSGRPAEAKAQLEQAAADAQGDARARGYVEVNLAMWTLNQDQPTAAARRLTSLLRQEGLEANLRAEAELLLARSLRLQGEGERALGHARAAAPLGVAAELELALCERRDPGDVIEQARKEEARFELALALLNRGASGDAEEALELIRAHDYRILLDSPQHAPTLAALAQNDQATLELFPLHLVTFGSFRVRFLGRQLTMVEFPTRKSAALLLRLALAARPLPRELLAEEFWGDSGNPGQSLQTALYHLNRTLGVHAVGGRKGMVELLYPVDLDLSELERRADEILDTTWAHGSDEVRAVLMLAQGEPLADFTDRFDDERRQAEAILLRLWRRLADLEADQPQRAAEALEMLLRLDPYDLDSRQSLIGIYADLGEPEQARRQEERLRLLEGEL